MKYMKRLPLLLTALTFSHGVAFAIHQSDLPQLRNALYTLVNAERTNSGLHTLRYDTQIEKAAEFKSQDLVVTEYWSHDSMTPGFEKLSYRLKQFGIFDAGYFSENLAHYQQKSDDVMIAARDIFRSWKNSQGHYQSIMNTEATHTALGAAIDKNGDVYVTEVFVGRDAEIAIASGKESQNVVVSGQMAEGMETALLVNNQVVGLPTTGDFSFQFAFVPNAQIMLVYRQKGSENYVPYISSRLPYSFQEATTNQNGVNIRFVKNTGGITLNILNAQGDVKLIDTTATGKKSVNVQGSVQVQCAGNEEYRDLDVLVNDYYAYKMRLNCASNTLSARWEEA